MGAVATPHRPALLTSAVLAALAALLLPACGTDGPLLMPATSAGPAAAASAPAKTSSVTVASSAAGPTVQVGTRKVELVGVEFDPRCQQLVAPFDATDNVGDLLSLGAELAGQGMGKAVAEQMQNLQQSGSAKKTAQPPIGANQTLRRAALRMNWMPMALEQRYGRYLLEQMHSSERLMPADSGAGRRLYPQAQALLKEVLSGVKEPTAYQFEIFVSREPGENAMALPGGLIVIDKALLEKPELRNKAYFALAHEVSHVLQRHQTRAMQARVIDALSLKASLPDMVKTIHQAHSEPVAVMRLLIGGKLLFEKHAANQELQADACAVRVLDVALANDRRLIESVQAFASALPKPAPEKPAAAPAAANTATTRALPATQTQASSGLDALANLTDLVSRPVDQHPTTAERVKNLAEMLVLLRQRPVANAPVRANANANKAKTEALPVLKGKAGG